jgi:hypothetical protein
MQNRKAPDELSLVAEHLRNGGPIVCYILEKLFNKIHIFVLIIMYGNGNIFSPDPESN